MIRFFIITILVALLIFGLTRMLEGLGQISMPSFHLEILVFFVLSNTGLYWLVTQLSGSLPADFVKIYLGATVLRLIFFSVFIFILMRLDLAGIRGNTIFFLACYLLFTVQEVWSLYNKVSGLKGSK